MSTLAERLMKSTKLSKSAMMDQSTFFGEKSTVVTDVPIINLALSSWLHQGFTSGLTVLAGPSKHFKSALGLLMCAAYMRKHPESIMLFYDSEFGASTEYFNSAGIDISRVLHLPITNIEDLKFDLMNKIQDLGDQDKVILFVDSVGNLASKKEVEDAINEKSVADMTRAKQLKSLFRMVTPHLTLKDIPMVVVNHVYEEIGAMYAKTIVSGGTGIYYSASQIMIIGRRQIKNENDPRILGWEFVLNIEKSRSVREKCALPFSVTYEGGIDRYSGLLEIARLAGYVVSEKKGWYKRACVENDKSWRKSETSCPEFWDVLLNSVEFQNKVHDMYKIGGDSKIDEQMDVLLVDPDATE